MSSVSFCGLRFELAENSPTLDDIKFTCGKNLEDCFENLNIRGNEEINGIKGSGGVQGIEIRGEVVFTNNNNNFNSSSSSSSRVGVGGVGTGELEHRGSRQLSEIRVETLENQLEMATSAGPSCSSASSSSNSGGDSTKESTPVALDSENVISFVSGNPYVDVSKGILHLFKENSTTSLEEGVIRSQMIAMLAIPPKIKTPELLQFTAPCHSQLEMIRIIQYGSLNNQYMALFRFRCQSAADEFYDVFNGRPFNSFENDLCSLVYISKVETCKESEYYPMISGYTELPLCSICLERMDESVSTVLTILCNHTFHGSCLALWEDSSCPVCRYVQTPEVVAEQRCSECQSSEDLWICLICGYVGCGRYVGGHAHAHFTMTQHCYTMELGENRVWDYVGDNFVHRLVQTDSADGKLVEAQGQDPKDSVGDHINVDSAEKMDSLQLEYTYLLTSQLESQRRYYEEKINRIAENSSREVDEIHKRAKDSIEEKEKIQEKMGSLMKEKTKNEQKIINLNSKVNKLIGELKEEKQMNESLRQNQSDWQKRLNEQDKKIEIIQNLKDKEVNDLQEQLRDLMFYLEAQNKISNSPLNEEIKEGHMMVGSPSPSTPKVASSTGARSKRKNKKT